MTAILFALWVISFFACFLKLQELYNGDRSDWQTFVNLAIASIPVFNIIITWMFYRIHDSED